MNLQTQINQLTEGYKAYLSNTSTKLLEIQSTIDVIVLIEANIDVLQKRMFFNRHNVNRFEILEKCLERLKERHKKAINYLYETKKQ